MKGKDLLHSRNITVSTYEVSQDEILVEGILRDDRLHPVISSSKGIEIPAGTIHHMKIEMVVSVPSLQIRSISAGMSAHPFPDCTDICEEIRKLEGLRLLPGFTGEVRRRMDKTNGCLHLTNLLLAMGSAAVQGAWAFFSRKREQMPSVSPEQLKERASMVLDSCRVWRSDGPRAAELRKRIGQSATADSEEDMGGRKLVITIDGPAGSGKSTVSRRLAEKLSYLYLDTGALYRALAYRAIREGTNQDDEKALAELCLRARVSVQLIDGQARYFAGGEDVSDRIRTEEVGLVASRISAVAEVRKALLPVQREAGKRGGIVAEGRDMGTVVFENADVKFYLDASESERVSRRCKELAERGGAADLDRVKKDLSIRDRQDKERAVAPLKVPEGAFVVDTTALNVDQVLQQMLEDVRRRMEESS